jgi:hypothetical protein
VTGVKSCGIPLSDAGAVAGPGAGCFAGGDASAQAVPLAIAAERIERTDGSFAAGVLAPGRSVAGGITASTRATDAGAVAGPGAGCFAGGDASTQAVPLAIAAERIERVLAYSTVSQLGYMFLAMGVGAFAAGIFHLYTHAFFKALLFLGSGAVIHALHGQQDMRYMGGLRKDLPITYWTFLIGTLAIAGVPFLSGFFSKDEILWKTFSSGHPVLWGLAVFAAFLTAVYMFRLLYMTFYGTRRRSPGASAPGDHPPSPESGAHLHDAPPAMAIALVVLAIGSVGAGLFGVPHALGGHNRIEAFLEPSFHAMTTSVPNEPGVVVEAPGHGAGIWGQTAAELQSAHQGRRAGIPPRRGA